MAAMVSIDADQRQVLRDLQTYRLFAIGHRRLAAAVLDGTPHERLASEFGDDLRLMGELGWDPEQRGDVVLTMRRRPLELALRRMREDAVDAKTNGIRRRPTETDEEQAARFQLAERVCEDLLAALA